jgi:hypothetical protein
VLNDNLNALCIGPESESRQLEPRTSEHQMLMTSAPGTTCDVILAQIDRFANALIGVGMSRTRIYVKNTLTNP